MKVTFGLEIPSLSARFMGPTWDQYGVDRTQMGPRLAPWTFLSGRCLQKSCLQKKSHYCTDNLSASGLTTICLHILWIPKLLLCVTWNPYQTLEEYATDSTVDLSTFSVYCKKYTKSLNFDVFCCGQLVFSISVMLFYCHWAIMRLSKKTEEQYLRIWVNYQTTTARSDH